MWAVEGLSYQFKIGDLECLIVNDGSRSLGEMTSQSPAKFFFGDVSKELEDSLRPYGGLDPSSMVVFNYLLVKDRDQLTLIDAGCGDQSKNLEHPSEPAGMLQRNLSESGVQSEDIQTVVISHCHWDHFGGVFLDGELAFLNAAHVMSAVEAEHIRLNVKGWALEYLDKLGSKMIYINSPMDLSSRIRVLPAQGHTPGTITVEASSNGFKLLYTSDVIIHSLHVEHPNWSPSFEADRKTAAMTRMTLVEKAHIDGTLLHAPHMPSPGLGKIIRTLTGFRWEAVSI